jgi:hypothetical protein
MPTRTVRHSSPSSIRSGHFSGFVPSWGTLATADLRHDVANRTKAPGPHIHLRPQLR